MDNTINIVIAASKEYSKYAAITLMSLYENNKNEEIRIFYYYNEPMENELKYLREITEKNSQKFIGIHVNNDRMKGTEQHGSWHNSTWYRYLALEDLKGSCQRIMILGTDILITKSIREFYFQDLSEKCIAAVQDSVNMYEWYVLFDECKEKGKDITDYFNADVVLFDLSKIEDSISLSKMLECYQSDNVYCMDQGILNYYFFENVKVIKDYTYNYGVNAAYETLTQEKYLEGIKQAAVLHFAGRKPWNSYDGSFAHELWLRYARDTKYCGEIENQIIQSLAPKNFQANRNVERLESLISLLDRFWSAEKDGTLSKKLSELDIHRVAIYGLGRVGRHLIQSCQERGVSVSFAIDNGCKIEYDNIPIYNMKNYSTDIEVDCIVITPIYQYKKIKSQLEKITKNKIISMEMLL